MLTFTLLTFAISWTLWALIAATGLDINTNLTAGLAYVVGGFGPALVGAILVRRSAKPSDLWPRILQPQRIRPVWWGVVLLLYPATILVAYLIVGLIWPGAADLSPARNFVAQPPGLIPLTVLFIATVGPISEEPGWRGYALDRLQARHSPLVASLILGVVWWAWHLPLIAVRGSFLHGSGASPTFLAGYLGTVLLYSILFTWVYNRTLRSVLSTILMHFSINLTTGILTPPFEVFMVTTFLLIVISAGVILRSKMWNPMQLSRVSIV
jgi:membrane protease YdiL (CAAX protease family)